MTIKNILSTVGTGSINFIAAVSNATLDSQIDELDQQIKELTEKRAALVAKKI